MSSASPDYLLRGAVFALEQCGLLLRDAGILYSNRSYASAIALAAFAREELGRYRILRELWKRTVGGESFTLKQICDRCDDHVKKQREGMTSLVQRSNNDRQLGRLMQTRRTSDPSSREWQKADEELDKITQTQLKRTPDDRHSLRMKALYVEPRGSSWNRPSQIAETSARNFLIDASNDYALQRGQGYINSADLLRHIDPAFYAALEQWQDRPDLEPPLPENLFVFG